jgi:DNA-binding HxlR family transcriptional regulator
MYQQPATDPYGPGTATRDAIERMANRWTVLVVHVLEDGPTRFNAIKRRLDVSSQVLTRVLRDLERDGLIERTVHTEAPVRVDYSLTSLGATMCIPVHSVREWAENVAAKIAEARADWDRAHPTDQHE